VTITAVPGGRTTQVFINLTDNAFLDNGKRDFGYAVFGKVVAGMSVVDDIATVRLQPLAEGVAAAI
jgi:peptidyl-prolyl cis-trans isomerase A (cyclophilin A)